MEKDTNIELFENTRESQASHTASLEKQLWAVADILRGQMDASEYQRYMLGIIFYKYLSENFEKKVLETYSEDRKNVTVESLIEENKDDIVEEMQDIVGYYIETKFFFRNLIEEIKKGVNGLWNTDYLKSALVNIEESSENFNGLFSDLDLNSSNLGISIQDRNNKMAEVILTIGNIHFHLDDTEIDVLGDAYEYLIANFASSAGKKGGEFYTPQAVAILLSMILAYENPNMSSVYDPTCGSGSLLLRVAKEVKKENKQKQLELGENYVEKYVKINGQELNTTTYNLARMNMAMHGLRPNDFTIHNDNTLTKDKFEGEHFDGIVANPPYSAKWTHTTELESDPRFVKAGKLAPKDKADFAFVQHCWEHLNDGGTAAIVLPHGVLFRSGAEGVIRKYLLENNAIHAVIGLPADLFYGTGIATVIIILKKGRKEEDVLFIDASENFTKKKNGNDLDPANIKKIFDAYTDRKDVEKFANVVKLDSIQEEEHNLNISKYVDISPDEVIIDINEVHQEIQSIQNEINNVNSVIDDFVSQLHEVDEIPVIKKAKDTPESPESLF